MTNLYDRKEQKMDFEIRPLKYEERKYTYAQSQQLKAQTGSIGRLRGDFDAGGYGFYTSWEDHRKDLKTAEFQDELDDVINSLRSDEYGLISNRSAMSTFVRQYPKSAMKGNYTTEYGFRVDTEKHSYLLRCNPIKGDYNFYCFCYKRESLDRHIENAGKDIRFIDSSYNELFRIPDGEKIKITMKNGNSLVRSCRYIDEYHLEVGDKLYHICEFAESMERSQNTYEPNEAPLPKYCFGILPSTGEVIKITRYETGYTPMKARPVGDAELHGIDCLNDAIGVSKAQAAAMQAGSMFGWDCPAAKVNSYNENGKAIRSADRER